MNNLSVPLCAWLLLGVCASHAQQNGLQYTRTVTTPALTQVELLAVTLDSAVYEATQTSLYDIRLLDGKGDAVPYLLRRAKTTRWETVRETWTAREAAARPLDGGGLEITFELDNDDPRPNGLTLVSPLKDFEHRVRVFSSPDGERWTPVGEETVVFDYSRYMDVRSDHIQFPETGDLYFRIVIDDITAEQESDLLALTRRLRGIEETGREERVTIVRRPFRIERIELWRETEQEQSAGDKKSDYPVSGIRVEEDPKQQRTLILFHSQREPLTSFELETPERNFSRRVAVEIEEKQGVQTSWSRISQDTLSRIDFQSLQREHLEIDFPEARVNNYRLVVDNRDSPPLKVTGVKARGNVYELLFLATPATGYQLVYGSATAAPPQYDTAAITQVLDEGFRPTPAELGPLVPGTAQSADIGWSDLLNNRPLLFSLIGLLVISLAWGLYHAMKRVDNLPSE